MVVHPGCKCQHNFLTLDTEEGDKQDKRDEAVTSTSQNLNLAAVMLHLVTDVLRSILILVSAILILCGGVHDAERADAQRHMQLPNVCKKLDGQRMALSRQSMVYVHHALDAKITQTLFRRRGNARGPPGSRLAR